VARPEAFAASRRLNLAALRRGGSSTGQGSGMSLDGPLGDV
jgi:hypothetical protein